MKQLVKKKWLACLLVFAMLISVCGFGSNPITVSAADTQNFQITGTYRQTEARTMFSMINAFRTGKDAWVWNEADSEKVQVTGLLALNYDYNLEKIAMQRAMELVAAYSHTRPNGEQCFTAYTKEYQATGENIAIGTSDMSAAKVFELWQETDKKYAEQGHRRNMLSKDFQSVGIAYVYYKGCHYWVQEFGDRVVTAAPTPANDSETAVTVPVSTSRITALTCTSSVDRYQLTAGETAALPTLSYELRTSDTVSYAPSALATATEAPAWQMKDTAIATISGTNILAVTPGTTTLTAKVNGQTVEIPVTVAAADQKKEDLSSAVVTLSASSFTYDGQAKVPTVTVTYNGAALTPSTDYTVAYSGNTDSGTATVTVAGAGKYSGTATATFTIKKATNKITIKKTSYSLKYSAKKAQTITLKPKALAGKITYSSNKAKVKVSKNGKVTIAKKFSGKATITIKVTDKNYKTATKKVVINVKKK